MAKTDADRPRYYDPSKNPDNAFIPGVPLADLTAEQWAALPKGARADAEATEWYRLTPVPKAKAAESSLAENAGSPPPPSGPAPRPDVPLTTDAPAEA